MTRYRCKHAVEAMRWDGESREALTVLHREKTGVSSTFVNERAVVHLGDDWYSMMPGEWLVWSSGEFLVMDDEQFREAYEEVV